MESLATYDLSRMLLQRAIALVYLIGFLVAVNQFRPLLGERGLLPVPLYTAQVPWTSSPSLFYLWPEDAAFAAAAWLGVGLSALALLGLPERGGWWASALVWSLLYALYFSFVNVGQTFYAFGWESLLLEAGFYAIFLGPAAVHCPRLMNWIYRWMLFRIMFGAGLIKLRNDSCWRDLTCLFYHFETQPMPNPLSWYFHWLPKPLLQGGVLFNHFVELVVPFGLFLPQPFASAAGLFNLAFHSLLAISGNFAFLSFGAMVLSLACFDDRFLSAALRLARPALQEPSALYSGAVYVLGAVVALCSVPVVMNLLSAHQAMNASYNPLYIANTYGAFGSITRPRYEVVVEGTAEEALTSQTRWREYEFKGKPGDVRRRPPQVAPYHLRLDWLMWFAGFGDWRQHAWFVHFLDKLLEGDRATLSLLRSNPFPGGPPKHVRALRYEYHFTTPAERRASGAWWTRRLVGPYFPAVSRDDPWFRELLMSQGWQAP